MSEQYGKTTLANGVRVVTGPMSGVRSASLIFYYGVGSRYERPAIAGVSHFLEHMLFKGTEKRADPMMISQEIEWGRLAVDAAHLDGDALQQALRLGAGGGEQLSVAARAAAPHPSSEGNVV